MPARNSQRFECEECGKEFWKPKSRVADKNIRFCSRTCRWDYQRKHPQEFYRGRVKLKCPVCGAEFERLAKRNRAGFCSKKCYWEFKGRVREAANPNCSRCQKPLFSPHKAKSGLCLGCWRKHAAEEGFCFKPKLNGWSWKYKQCVECGTTQSKHHGKGVCGKCRGLAQARKRKGTFGKKCAICGEKRAIEAAHAVPKARFKRIDAPWNILYLCATHHRCFDTNELYASEFKKIEGRVKSAFERFREKMDRVRFVRPAFVGK